MEWKFRTKDPLNRYIAFDEDEATELVWVGISNETTKYKKKYSMENPVQANPDLDGAALTVLDHYPECHEAKVLAQFEMKHQQQLEDVSWFSETGRLGIKYEGSVPMPSGVNLPFRVVAFEKGNLTCNVV